MSESGRQKAASSSQTAGAGVRSSEAAGLLTDASHIQGGQPESLAPAPSGSPHLWCLSWMGFLAVGFNKS